MLSSDLMQRIRLLELLSRRLVNNSFAGAYHSVFKGRGMAFDAVRPYQPGDDVRDIDWNVTARSDEAYVKSYVEERELTVILVLDASASCLFGTQVRSKRDLAAEIGAVLALSAIANNDRVGLLIFSDTIERYIPPRKGRNHVLRLIRELMATPPANKGTDIRLALQSLSRMLKQKAIIFLLSDFLAPVDVYKSQLLVVGQKHDLIAVMLSDPLEMQWGDAGLVALRDAETGEETVVDTTSKIWRREFGKQTAQFYEQRDASFRRAGVDRINVNAQGDYVRALASFFHQRARVAH
ncbi:MAG: DUF58 domain-containing protein [Aggregatilineales bacterium]